jgi:hypothetical protein
VCVANPFEFPLTGCILLCGGGPPEYLLVVLNDEIRSFRFSIWSCYVCVKPILGQYAHEKCADAKLKIA